MFPIFCSNFRTYFFLEAAKQAVEKLVKPDFLVLIWDNFAVRNNFLTHN